MSLKLWLISQDANDGYDTYDSAVVAAATAEEAQRIHPDNSQRWFEGRGWVYAKGHDGQGDGWTSPDRVQAVEVGVAAAGVSTGVVCASFNAG